MEDYTALYFDGTSARATPVRVTVLPAQLQLYAVDESEALGTFPFTGMAYNQVRHTHYVYLNASGLQYVQFAEGAPGLVALASSISKANPHWGQGLLRQKTAVLIGAVVALSIGLYLLLLTLIPALGSRLIGVPQEQAIGQKLKDVLLRESALQGMQVDSTGTKKLQAFANQLQLSRHYKINTTLVRSNVVNAYALPGGEVVVYHGLLKKIKTHEALAALLAHESTHINERHSLKSLLRNAANGIVVAVVFSDATGISGALVGNAKSLSGLQYSRGLEQEADKKGMELLLQNNVPPSGMKQLLQTLEAEGNDVPQSLSFLSTHPLTKARVQAAVRFETKHPQRGAVSTQLQQAFQKLKDNL